MWRGLSLAALAFMAPSTARASERAVTLAVSNMTCATCPAAVKIAIKRVPGVKDVRVDFARKTAVAVFDDAQTTSEQLAEASRLAGYPATVKE
jgi:periplasmic mercuric ion binding protein